MTDEPTEPTNPPPSTIGTNPKSADEVNGLVGTHLRGFVATKATIQQDQNFMAATDLKAAPYWFSDTQETDIKTAISQLDQALQGIDMTFISRIIGM
jgi:hypothetical protein